MAAGKPGQFSIVTRLQDDPMRKRDLIPDRDRHFFFSEAHPVTNPVRTQITLIYSQKLALMK